MNPEKATVHKEYFEKLSRINDYVLYKTGATKMEDAQVSIINLTSIDVKIGDQVYPRASSMFMGSNKVIGRCKTVNESTGEEQRILFFENYGGGPLLDWKEVLRSYPVKHNTLYLVEPEIAHLFPSRLDLICLTISRIGFYFPNIN